MENFESLVRIGNTSAIKNMHETNLYLWRIPAKPTAVASPSSLLAISSNAFVIGSRLRFRVLTASSQTLANMYQKAALVLELAGQRVAQS